MDRGLEEYCDQIHWVSMREEKDYLALADWIACPFFHLSGTGALYSDFRQLIFSLQVCESEPESLFVKHLQLFLCKGFI